MVRTLGWFLLAAFGMAVIAALSLPASDRDQLMGALGRRSLAHSSDGMGYDDGRLVWRDSEPLRITVEQLPTLENRRLGTSWITGFLHARMSWFGRSLREAIAMCLELPADRVLGDESLDGIWFDIDAAQSRGLLDSGFGDWEPVRARILEGLCEHYGVTVTRDTRPMRVKVLRAGPGWAEHLQPGSGSHVMRQDGALSVKGMRVDALLLVLRETLGVQFGIDMDTDAVCSFDIAWDGSDPDSLARVLAEELDLHVEDAVRDLPIAHVDGVARPPEHLR